MTLNPLMIYSYLTLGTELEVLGGEKKPSHVCLALHIHMQISDPVLLTTAQHTGCYCLHLTDEQHSPHFHLDLSDSEASDLYSEPHSNKFLLSKDNFLNV